MPDDDIVFPPGMPEEIQAQIRRQIERNQMMEDDSHLRLVRFWDEATSESLIVFSSIMARAQKQPTYAAYMEGYADALLRKVHNICPGCGKNHDEDLEAALAAHQAQAAPPDLPKPPMSDEALAAAWTGPDSDAALPDPQCSSCHGDRAIKVCNHPAGTHGQFVGGAVCPEPLLVPCPQCLCPEWFTSDELADSPCHPLVSLLPIETVGRGVCFTCGTEMAYPVTA